MFYTPRYWFTLENIRICYQKAIKRINLKPRYFWQKVLNFILWRSEKINWFGSYPKMLITLFRLKKITIFDIQKTVLDFRVALQNCLWKLSCLIGAQMNGIGGSNFMILSFIYQFLFTFHSDYNTLQLYYQSYNIMIRIGLYLQHDYSTAS